MAARSPRAVLEPASSSVLNVLQHSPPPCKRLKLSHESGEYAGASDLGSAFTIGTHGSNEQLTLTPIVLLPRSNLPLSWLDPLSTSSAQVHSGKLFAANVPTLKNNLQPSVHPMVLVTRRLDAWPTENTGILASVEQQGHGGLRDHFYVIERVKSGIYALCALHGGVEEGDLLVLSKSSRSISAGLGTKAKSNDELCGGVWLERTKLRDVSDSAFPVKPNAMRVSLAFGSSGKSATTISSTLEGNESMSFTTNSLGPNSLSPESSTPIPDSGSHSMVTTPPLRGDNDSISAAPEIALPPADRNDSHLLQSPQDLLDNLRAQYLEALYISKTSVAYFAKGPLSRARAAFQSADKDSSTKPSDLASYYRECIISMKKLDVKYRESLPNVIRSIPAGLPDPEATAPRATKRKRKSTKKKMGRSGLYSEEDEFITKWWKGRVVSESSSSVGSMQGEMRRLVADLRLRETQLQILLILETISLETTASSKAGESQSTEAQSAKITKPAKAKRTQDLTVQLELLADRLCIWHTVGFDEILPPDGSKDKGNDQQPEKAAEKDKLRDFCTEVIIPFYAARLPEQCPTICRKMGAPVAVSPVRSVPKAGSSVKRQPPQRSQRTFQRVLTDDKPSSKGKVPSLPRSNTAPSAPQLKREASDSISLSSIAAERGGARKPKRVDNREIDLDAVAKQHESKLKKMNKLWEQKRELDAAIHALRKPNRELVSRDFAESAEQRATSRSSRKPKHPVRNPFAQGVQVMATPKGTRKKDCDSGLPPLPQSWTLRREKPVSPLPPPSSELQVIPSSTSRPVLSLGAQKPSSRQRGLDSIHETPSKPSNHRAENSPPHDAFKMPNFPASNPDGSPTLLRKSRSHIHLGSHGIDISNEDAPSTIEATPPRPQSILFTSGTSAGTLHPTQEKEPVVFTTPVKSQAVNSGSVPKSCTGNGTIAATPEKSIYDSLGWNDDDDDDELALS